MSESNLEKFNRLFDDFNFAVNEKTIKKEEDGGYSLTYEVIDNGKKCKIVLKTQKEIDSCKEHVFINVW